MKTVLTITVLLFSFLTGLSQSVSIGKQQWMSKNLDVAFYRNGDPIPQVTDSTAWAALTTGAWCYYNNDTILGKKYGKLYNCYAVKDPRGLAPEGWHISSYKEWSTLGDTLGGREVAGGKMKEPGTLNWKTPNTGADNSSGWAGLPGGIRSNKGQFSGIGKTGYWWSSSYRAGSSETVAYLFFLSSISGSMICLDTIMSLGFSVRCLKD